MPDRRPSRELQALTGSLILLPMGLAFESKWQVTALLVELEAAANKVSHNIQIRNGQTTVDLSPPGFTFTNSFAQYNFSELII